jgi:Mn-containing catalase
MTREVTHPKMFEAALDAIMNNFPPRRLAGTDEIAHAYFDDSFETGNQVQGFEPWLISR